MKVESKRWLPYALFAAAVLPAIVLRDFSPSNELRYLSIADEAIEHGNLFAFTCQGEPYADKPPLYLWIVMLGKTLFGCHRMWFLALFSLIPALVICRTMDSWIGRSLAGRPRRAGQYMLMSCGLFAGLAVFLRMDMLMCMFIALALHTFWKIYSGEGDTRRNRLLFPFYTFMALFTKGPVGVLVPLLSVAVFLLPRRRRHMMGRVLGWRTWGVLLAGCALWFTAVWAEGGTEYLDNLLFHQTLDRAVDAFHHKEPVYYYFVTMWYAMAPWSPLIIGVIVSAAVRRTTLTEAERFLAVTIAVTIAMLSAFSSKLTVYLAPVIPAAVYLALSLMQRMRSEGWLRAAAALPAAVWTLSLVSAAVWSLCGCTPALDPLWIAAAAPLFVSGVAALWLICRRRELYRPVNILALGLFAAIFVGGLSFPSINASTAYGQVCGAASRLDAERGGDTAYYVWGIRRPESMDVYLGRDVEEVTAEDIVSGRCRGGILMLDCHALDGDGELRRFLAERRCDKIGGRYAVVVLDD